MQLARLPFIVLVSISLLSGCGFHLRGDTKIPADFNPIYLDASELNARQLSQLQQTLQRAGAELATDPESAQRLWVDLGSPSSRIIADSGVSDVELRRVSMSLKFRLVDADGEILLQDDIVRGSQLELDTNNVLAHERQFEQLQQQLQRELFRVMLFQMTHFR